MDPISLDEKPKRPKEEDGGEDVGQQEKQHQQEIHVYRRRWYILSIFSVYCAYQGYIWNNFSPITYALQLAYDWSDGTIALLANWGPIAFVVCTLPFSYIFERCGARYSVLLGSLLVVVGTAVRTPYVDDPTFIALCHTGNFINGASGVMVMSLPPLISSLWFPEKERIFATSVSQAANIVGIAFSQALGPVAVPFDDKFNDDDDIDVPQSEIDRTRDDIHMYMVWTAVFATANFIALVLYFPDKPDRPPSRSSAVERTDDGEGFSDGWSQVLKSTPIWMVCLAFSIPGGIQIGWEAVMAIQLEPLGVTDTEVGNVGFMAMIFQAVGATVVALAMDHFRDKIKLSVMALLTVSFLCFAWLALISFEIIPYSLGQLYVAVVVGTSSFYACFPLFFELAIMISYPISESLIGAFLTGTYNFVVMIFLLIMMIPDMDVTWVNYVLIAGTVVGMPLIYMVKKPKDYQQGSAAVAGSVEKINVA